MVTFIIYPLFYTPLIHANPIKARDIPRQEKSERRYLSAAEVDRLLDAAPTDAARLLVAVLIYTGVRPGEAKGVKVKDLDAHRGRLRIRRDVDDLGNEDETKTRDHRDVPIGGDLLYDLEDAAEDKPADAWLLPDEHGNVWTETRWRRAWAAMTKTAEIGDFTTYELRHTAASLAIHSGANVKTVQRMLGHTSAAMTLDIYGHLWDDELDALPAAMDAHMKAERQRFRDRAAPILRGGRVSALMDPSARENPGPESDPGFWWSRLRESNSRPFHYE